MTWYCLGLADGPKNISEEAWQLAWEVSKEETDQDDGNAIFKKVGPDNRLLLFFTPSSHLLAESFGARPCAKPSLAGLSLVAGSERAQQIHFGRPFGLLRGVGALRAWRGLILRTPVSDEEFNESALNRHIRRLFHEANTAPREGATMLQALASWAEDNMPNAQMHELRPAVDALRRAEREDPATLDALLEETDQQIAQARCLHDAASLLLREVAEWVPTGR